MDHYYDNVIRSYDDTTLDGLHDMLDDAKEDIRKANELFMSTGMSRYKDAKETASIRLYNLQVVIRHRMDSANA